MLPWQHLTPLCAVYEQKCGLRHTSVVVCQQNDQCTFNWYVQFKSPTTFLHAICFAVDFVALFVNLLAALVHSFICGFLLSKQSGGAAVEI